MKRLAPLLLLIALVGCHKKDVEPALPTNELLYRTWQLSQSFYDSKLTLPDQFVDIVTFSKSGYFQEGLPDGTRWCCSPSRFEGNNESIRFIWDTSNPTCAFIDCRASPLTDGVTWQITTLTQTSLVLTRDRVRLEFVAKT